MKREDLIERQSSLDTILPFEFGELTPVEYIDRNSRLWRIKRLYSD